ncbi:Putative 2-aminoethylphosphonate-binding periplasmic protein [Pandoraea horticolens]|uniref:2-aminoethylphosphonate-binding periplasmic protein n=1 Tax=Pandoraea horticolens TaxID=2508298 RepID=A0A5E4W8F1_9BURK|nr:extracellular solute-binding protein [Pandoraea horticolens]VVE21002.1 Putative 2-aminoethylphosphonate-binding periplasmic protein [Pandoraea horticolens]
MIHPAAFLRSRAALPSLATLAVSFALLAGAAGTAFAQTGASGTVAAPLYPGEADLYAKAAEEGLVVSFDTGPEWANWKALFAEFRKRYPKVEITYNDIGSAATVVALDKSRRRPQADTAYYFAASALDAVQKDVVAPFKPINFDALPKVFRDNDGRWFTIHSLNIAFLVNTKLVKHVPQSWADLLKPEYKNAVVYLDPRSTGQGQVAVFAAAYAFGGNVDNPKPGADFFGKLRDAGNVMRVEGTTPYAKFVKGEIPILIGYENDGLKAKYTDGMGDAAQVVIPKEASVSAPYAISLVKNGPNPDAAKLWLNLIMSPVGQALFAQGYVRPAVPGVPLSAEMRARMPDAPQVRPLDVARAAAQKAEVDRLWSAAVLAK